MEVSVIGSCSQIKIGRVELAAYKELGFSKILSPNTTISFGLRTTARINFSLKAIPSQSVRSHLISSPTSSAAAAAKSKWLDGVRLYVGLPLDTVSECNAVNHARAISAGLRALKLLGVDGVEMPVWWGIAEKKAMGKYDWSAYIALAEMVENAGLKLHVSLCFHACENSKISLPEWVSRIGESQPNIFFTDRSGHSLRECLSLSVDDLPILEGKTPIQVYHGFCESFKSSFLPFMGSTITGISMGLGPDGELRYPSHHQLPKSNKIPGVGEFQCYDKNMLNLLKQHAETTGNPYWGLDGPHDVPSYDQTPSLNNFFKDQRGSWETPYGDFFLSWYSSQLISHGNRLLSLASSTFSDAGVTISGKVPLMHSWFKTRSHASELTAGFYNTSSKDGYEAVAEMFARNSCKMVLPGMDLLDEHQLQDSLSSPELLLAQIRTACERHGVEISGQNLSVAGGPDVFEQMRKNLKGKNDVDLFTYQRMGAYFFSPEHFPKFTEFFRSLNQPELHSDDCPKEEDEAANTLCTSSESALCLQAA